MRNSWLVQRLNKPWIGHERLAAFGEAFQFGGGRRNGGLSDEAMDLIRGIWSFDYMGASEYEWGAVPEGLNKMARAKLVAFSFPGIPDDDGSTVYVVCPEEMCQEVQERVAGWAAGEGPETRDFIGIDRTLRPESEWDGENVGWVELDNGFAFFTDKTMFEKTCRLFGVES